MDTNERIYWSSEITAACDAIINASNALGIDRTEALKIITARFGEKLVEPTGREELEAVARELGIEL